MEENKLKDELLDEVSGGINNLKIETHGGDADYGNGGENRTQVIDNSTTIYNYYEGGAQGGGSPLDIQVER